MSAQSEIPNSENRLLAALSHASVVMQGLGILVGVLVYVTQRDKSRFAAYQALQAAVYQMANLILIGLLWMVWSVFYGLSITTMMSNPRATPTPFFMISLGAMLIPIAIMLVVDAFGLWGALRTWQGREFHYPLLGKWLERTGLDNGR
jgi:uncharacterized Tic20 family protein